MKNITPAFKNKKLNFQKLFIFGFIKQKNFYIYHNLILDNQFKLVLKIDETGSVFTQLNDIETNGEYVLHLMPDTTGLFVQKIREEYHNILSSFEKTCFEYSPYQEKTTLNLISYIKTTYGDSLEFLWPKFSESSICRRVDNKKWYAVFLLVKAEKLGISSPNKIEILDIRSTPEDISLLVDNQNYFNGYHMNKKHWLSVKLDGSVSFKEICNLIDKSYQLAKKK